MKIKRISLVAVAVPDSDEAFARFQRVLGLHLEEREVVASQKVEAALMPIGDAAIGGFAISTSAMTTLTHPSSRWI